jgi:Ca-activated chloride channel family protein
MTFLQPEYLNLAWLLVLVAIGCAYSLFALQRERKSLGMTANRAISRPSSLVRRTLQLAAALALAGCLIAALARPQIMEERQVAEERKLDVVIVLDTSPSMRAQDLYPSRLARATQVIRSFIQRKRPEDRFAMVSFADSALVLSYLTADPSNIEFYLDYLVDQDVLHYGTNIGAALKSGMLVLTRQTEIEPEAGRNKRVFILISDGEDQGDELKAAVDETIRRNLPVYCIGIGSRNGALIPIGFENGHMRYLTGEHDEPILTTFAEDTLRQVADRSGANYYRAYTGTDIDRAFHDIFAKAREVEGYRRVRQPRELYRIFLGAAFGLFLLRNLI